MEVSSTNQSTIWLFRDRKVRISPLSSDPTEQNPLVLKTMDGIQRYIASADDRPEDEVEHADPALGALAAQTLSAGDATHAYIYTTDIAAGEGAEAVLGSAGYEGSVTFVTGFRFIDDLLEKD